MKEIELDGLSFEIEASSEKASKNIDALTESLKKLGKATSAIRGLSSTSTQLTKLGKSLDGFSNRNAKALTKIAFALDALGRVGKIQISSSIGKRITDIANSSKDIRDDDLDRLERLADVLEKLGKVGDVKIPKMKIPKEQVDERVDQTNIDQNIKAITLRETTLAVNELSQSLVPLTQIMQTGTDTWAGFEQVINATGESISNVVGFLNEGIIEGTFTRIESVSGLLGDGISRAIVPAEQFSNALAVANDRAIELSNTIEGTWSEMSQGTPEIDGINSEMSESINLGEVLNTVVHTLNQAFAEVKATVSGIVASIDVILMILEFIVKAIKAIIGFIGRIIDGIRKAVSFAGQLLTPFKKIGAYVGKQLISPFEKAKNSIKSLTFNVRNLFDSFKRIAIYRLVRTLIATLTRGLNEGIHNLYQYSRLMNTEFAKSLDKIATASLYVKNSLAAMVSPVINAIAPAIDFLADKMVGLLNQINQFISSLLGKSTYTAARKLQDTFEKIKSAVIGIDELNIIGDDEVKDYANMFEELPIDDDEITKFADRLRKAFEAGEWDELGNAIGEKFNEIIDKIKWEEMGTKIGYYLDGVIKTAYYILDSINFEHFGERVAQLLDAVIQQIDWEYLGRLMIKQITALWDFVIGFLKELDWGAVATSIINFLKGAINEINDWINKYDWLEMGKILLQKLSNFFKNFDFAGLLRDFSALVGNAMKALKDLLTPLWQSFVQWWNNNIKGEDLGQTLKNLADYLVKFVDENILTPFLQAFMGEDALEGGSGLQKLKQVGENIIGGIRKGAEDWIADHLLEWVIKAIFGKWVWALCEAFGIASPAKTMIPYGENIIEGMLQGILQGMDDIGKWIRDNICTPFINGLEEIYKDVKEVAGKIWGWITEGFGELTDSIRGIAGTIWGWATEGLTNLKNDVVSVASTIWGWITEGFNNIVNKVKDIGNTVVGWFKDGTEDTKSEEVAKETGNTIISNIEEGATDKITDFNNVGQKIVDCIYESLSSVDDNGEVSLIEGLAQDIVSNLIGSMENSLDKNWKGDDIYAVLKDFSSSLVNGIYESMTSTDGSEENSLLEILSANIVESIVMNMKNFLSSDLRGYDLKSEFSDFAVLFTDRIYDALTKTDTDRNVSVIDTLGGNILISLVNGMRDSLTKNFENFNMDSVLQEFSETFVSGIYQALTDTKSSRASLLDELGTNIILSLIKGMNTAIQSNISTLKELGVLFSESFSKPIYDEIEKLKGLLLDLLNFAMTVFEQIKTGIFDLQGQLRQLAKDASDVFDNLGKEIEDAQTEIGKIVEDINTQINSIKTDITITITTIHRDVYESSGGGHATGGIIPHALGGIVNRYTLFNYKNQIHSMGEAGREAILPLDSYTGWMDEVAERVNERLTEDKESGGQISFEQALNNFFAANLQPVLSQIAFDTERTANKDMSVKIGNKEIKNAYDTQIRADGYSFTGGK